MLEENLMYRTKLMSLLSAVLLSTVSTGAFSAQDQARAARGYKAYQGQQNNLANGTGRYSTTRAPVARSYPARNNVPTKQRRY